MNRLSAFIFVFLAASISLAYSNPLIRTCKVNSGLYVEVSVDDPSDRLSLCQFGVALIGALAVIDVQSNNPMPDSVKAYVNHLSCEAANGLIRKASADSLPLVLCQFSDGSLIELDTLDRGLNHQDNVELNKVLGL